MWWGSRPRRGRWLADFLEVSALRMERFSPDPAVAEGGVAFADWHLVSLVLSLVTAVLAGIGLALAARMPGEAASPG